MRTEPESNHPAPRKAEPGAVELTDIERIDAEGSEAKSAVALTKEEGGASGISAFREFLCVHPPQRRKLPPSVLSMKGMVTPR